jgi:hypothetical protein
MTANRYARTNGRIECDVHSRGGRPADSRKHRQGQPSQPQEMKLIGFHGRSTMRLIHSIVIIAATSITAAYAGDTRQQRRCRGRKTDLAMTGAPFMQAFENFNPDLKGAKFVLADYTELSERQADSIRPYRWRTICRVAARWNKIDLRFLNWRNGA